METKIILKKFFDIQECQNFVNNFAKEKEIIKKKITPLVADDLMEYFVFLEYKERSKVNLSKQKTT